MRRSVLHVFHRINIQMRRRCSILTILRWSIPAMVCLILMRTFLGGSVVEVQLPEGVYPKDFLPFEPQGSSEFHPGSLEANVIPRIIHQTWRDTLIPLKFVDNIRSFVKHNPDWEYYLWTDDNSRLLLERHYPELLPLWDDYVDTGNKQRLFNVIRYVAMYVYGGVFVDLDTINYRPLDAAIEKHNCILPTEPFEHALINHVEFLITNAVFICRAKHPFFKFVLDNLHHYMHLSSHWDAAGPGFFTAQFKMYVKSHVTSHNSSSHTPELVQQNGNSPYFFKSDLTLAHPDSVYVPHSQYFTGKSDVKKHVAFQESCKTFHDLHNIHQRSCVHINANGWQKHSQYAFIDHFWQNNWYSIPQQYMYLYIMRWLFGTDIHQIVPHCKLIDA